MLQEQPETKTNHISYMFPSWCWATARINAPKWVIQYMHLFNSVCEFCAFNAWCISSALQRHDTYGTWLKGPIIASGIKLQTACVLDRTVVTRRCLNWPLRKSDDDCQMSSVNEHHARARLTAVYRSHQHTALASPCRPCKRYFYFYFSF